MLAEACTAAGIPDGVVNVVLGPGRSVGQSLVGHSDVNMVSFTGSTQVGVNVMRTAAERACRTHLELGGKAPFVVFDDADLEAAAQGAVAGTLINTGQDCTAATRAYVQRPLFDSFVDRVQTIMQSIKLGDTSSPETDLGPLISTTHQEQVAGMVDRARAAGGKIHCGGEIPADADLRNGSYYLPTLVTGLDQKAEIVQEEVFGPVLAVIAYDDDDHAVEIANNSIYGLSGAVFGGQERAIGLARRIRTGTFSINGGNYFSPDSPFGGYKQSGIGREMGAAGLEEFLERKTFAVPVAG